MLYTGKSWLKMAIGLVGPILETNCGKKIDSFACRPFHQMKKCYNHSECHCWSRGFKARRLWVCTNCRKWKKIEPNKPNNLMGVVESYNQWLRDFLLLLLSDRSQNVKGSGTSTHFENPQGYLSICDGWNSQYNNVQKKSIIPRPTAAIFSASGVPTETQVCDRASKMPTAAGREATEGPVETLTWKYRLEIWSGCYTQDKRMQEVKAAILIC